MKKSNIFRTVLPAPYQHHNHAYIKRYNVNWGYAQVEKLIKPNCKQKDKHTWTMCGQKHKQTCLVVVIKNAL